MATTNETIPKKVVGEKMKVFEDAYNRNDIATCTSFYAKECLLTVNGGREFTGKTREELTDFFDKLRNEQGATNLKIVVIKVCICDVEGLSACAEASCLPDDERKKGLTPATVSALVSSRSQAQLLPSNLLQTVPIRLLQLDGNVHVDNWVTDDCAGSCTVTWGKCEGEWVIVKEENTTFPKAA